jgi:hypothetical protein
MRRASDRLLQRRWPQTIHGCAVDTECVGHVRDCFPSIDPVDGLVALVRGKLLRPAEPHAGRLGPLAALAGAGADQGALELSETAQTSDSVRANCAPLRGKGNILDLPDRAQALQPGIPHGPITFRADAPVDQLLGVCSIHLNFSAYGGHSFG